LVARESYEKWAQPASTVASCTRYVRRWYHMTYGGYVLGKVLIPKWKCSSPQYYKLLLDLPPYSSYSSEFQGALNTLAESGSTPAAKLSPRKTSIFRVPLRIYSLRVSFTLTPL